MAVVLDSSAATQIAMGSQEGRAMQALILDDEEVSAPDFLQIECENSFWKYVHVGELSIAEAHDYYCDAVNLVTRYIRQNDLLDEVFTTASKLNHSVYDVVYLVLARRMAATLMSLDRKLLDLCEHAGVDCVAAVEVLVLIHIVSA